MESEQGQFPYDFRELAAKPRLRSFDAHRLVWKVAVVPA